MDSLFGYPQRKGWVPENGGTFHILSTRWRVFIHRLTRVIHRLSTGLAELSTENVWVPTDLLISVFIENKGGARSDMLE